MKKYIWLTIYFVWLVLLSYTFFYFSNKLKDIKKIVTLEQKKQTKQLSKDENESSELKTSSENTNSEISWSWNKNSLSWLENLELEPKTTGSFEENQNDVTWFDTEEASWSMSSWNTVSQIIPNKIYVWLAEAKLVSWSNYDDIFSLFNLEKYPTYKVDGKEIYFKQLKSIDYETEKANINQLIQEIWGNIVETNLFGDKQIFINPDLYYKKVVIMLVSYDQKVYFVTLPYSKYKQYKLFLKNVLFVNS